MIDAAGIVMQGVVFDVAADAAEEGRRSHVGDRGYERPQTDHQVRGPDATKRLRGNEAIQSQQAATRRSDRAAASARDCNEMHPERPD
eukprot:790362-Pleurochrysis_carterae.AAC.1